MSEWIEHRYPLGQADPRQLRTTRGPLDRLVERLTGKGITQRVHEHRHPPRPTAALRHRCQAWTDPTLPDRAYRCQRLRNHHGPHYCYVWPVEVTWNER